MAKTMIPLASQQTAQSLRRILADARGGRATLADLARAYEKASGAGLHGTAAELRGHLMDKLGQKTPGVGQHVALGLGTGILTHFLLKGK